MYNTVFCYLCVYYCLFGFHVFFADLFVKTAVEHLSTDHSSSAGHRSARVILNRLFFCFCNIHSIVYAVYSKSGVIYCEVMYCCMTLL